MTSIKKFKELTFLVYGLGQTGKSVINFFDKNKIKNYQVWDDKNKSTFKKKRPQNLSLALKKSDYIVLSPGVSLKKSKNKKKLVNYKKKIITDIDLIFLLKKFHKSIVITGTNGKSTTCKILAHVLKKNNYKVLIGGNIGKPVLDLKIKKNHFLIIEASSFQLSHSKFIQPDYAVLINISNDHLDWHGDINHYINSKLKIFKHQDKNQFSIINKKLKPIFSKKNFLGKLITPSQKNFEKIRFKIKNPYLKLAINNENMSFIFALSKLLKIEEKLFFNSLNSFRGLPHRYEIFFKKKNFIFINDSKATSFEATKFALKSTKNIFWILGGLPKKNDKFKLKNLSKNIIKAFIIGQNTNFFKLQLKNKVNFKITHNLKNSILQILRENHLFKREKNSILLSPAAASFDQFLNFEKRGEEFKKLSKYYARKYL